MTRIKIFEKVKQKVPMETTDWIRISLSFFLVGIIFLIFQLIDKPNSSNFTTIKLLTSNMFILSLITFPYIYNKDGNDILTIVIIKVVAYLLYTSITAEITLLWLELIQISDETIITLYSFIVAILIFFLIEVTLRSLFRVIKKIIEKIKTYSQKNNNGNIITTLKCFFTGAGIVTGFVIAILTIVKTTLEIFEIISKA